MAQDNEDANGFEDMTNRQMLRIILQEIADVRKELKEDIASVRTDLTVEIRRLDIKIDAVSSDLQSFRSEVRLNHATFVQNHQTLEHRVTVLEAA